MSNKITNDTNYDKVIPDFSPSKEVEKIKKEPTIQAKIAISTGGNKAIIDSMLKNDSVNIAPMLRAPTEQMLSNMGVNTKSNSSFNSKTQEQQQENKKDEILVNQKHLYDENNRQTVTNNHAKTPSIANAPSYSPTSPQYSESKATDSFLYLQLSYQGIVNESLLNKIKDVDRLDYYLDKLNKITQGFDGLKEQYKSILNDANKYKDAFVDYWYEVYQQIKSGKLETESDIKNFLKNNNIPDKIIKGLMSKETKSRADIEELLKDNFPFLDIPQNAKDYTLDNIDNLYNQLSHFLDNAFKSMPNVSMSDGKLGSITSHFDELKALIGQKSDKPFEKKLSDAKETSQLLSSKKEAIEIEIASETLSGMALLTFLLAKVRELTLKVALERAEGEQKLFNDMQEVTTKSLKEKVADQKAQIKKQEEIQYWAGIGLKILGGLLTLIAGVASIFTAGASMALVGVAVVMMAASVTLTVADEIYQAVNHKSFMEDVMAPVTEEIAKLVDKVVEGIVDMLNATMDALEALGLDKKAIENAKAAMQEKLKMAVKIIVTIGLLIGGVALSFAIGSAANAVTDAVKKLFTEQVKMTLKKMMEEYLEVMLGKMVKEIIMETMENLFKSINKMLSKDLTSQGLKTLNKTVVMSRLGTAAASSSVNIYTATITDKIIKSVADSKKLEEILKLIQSLIDKLMDSYHDQVDTLTAILQDMSEKSSVSNNTKANIVKNISM